MTIMIKVDSTPPPAPTILNQTINSSASTMRTEWSSVSDTSEILDYEFNVTSSTASNSYIGNFTNYTISITSGENYTIRVRARNGAGLNSSWGTLGQTPDTTPPSFLLLKPQGTIVNREIILAMRTNEKSACSYKNNTATVPYTLFTYTNSTYHEAKINLPSSVSFYIYNISCVDDYGNTNTTSINMTYSTSTAAGLLLTLPNTTIYTRDLVSVKVNVTNSLGEIYKSSFAVYINTQQLDRKHFTVLDLGRGIYNISFYAPKTRSNYNLIIGTSETNSSTATLPVVDLALTIRYTGQIAGQRNTSYASYAKTANYTVGFASDSDSISSLSNSTILVINTNVENGKAYLFITAPDADIDRKNDYLKDKTFDEVESPSFGYRPNLDFYTTNTLLKYSDITILGNGTVQKGRYSLIFVNKGFNSSINKTMVEVKIR